MLEGRRPSQHFLGLRKTLEKRVSMVDRWNRSHTAHNVELTFYKRWKHWILTTLNYIFYQR